jgi:hypothetical protein
MSLGPNMLCPLILFGTFQISTPEAEPQNSIYRAVIHPPSGIRENCSCPGHRPQRNTGKACRKFGKVFDNHLTLKQHRLVNGTMQAHERNDHAQ